MSLPRVRLDDCVREDSDLWRLGEAEAKYLLKVLRCYEGAAVEGMLASDGGRRLLMSVVMDGKGALLRLVDEAGDIDDKPEISLVMALLKSEQFDSVLRAASELGVRAIYPLVCERSVPRPDKSSLDKKVLRWQRILDEGTKVSGVSVPPVISKPVNFVDFNWDLLPAERYAALLKPDTVPISSVNLSSDGIAFAVGPEGDWSERESSVLIENSFTPVSLGRRVLRASTAVTVGCGWFRMSGLTADLDEKPCCKKVLSADGN